MKTKTRITIGVLASAAVLMGAAVIGYQDWQLRGTAPGNPGSGYLRIWADNATGKFKCLTSGGAACFFDSGSSGSVTSIATTSPITGGTITSTGTIACATCVTSASSLTSGQLMTGAGSQASQVGNLSGDITTSGGTATTLASVNGGSGSCGDATHVCAITTNAKGLTTSQTATAITFPSPSTFTDFPEKKYIPSANCSNATPGAGWSIPTSSAPTVSCHTGSNIQDGYLTFADAQSAQVSYLLPDDWDSTASLDSKIFFTDTSTSGTVIWQAATSCTTIAGGETDDQAFNTAQSFGTVTLGGTASAGWVATLTGMTKTGCAAGNLLHIKVSRTTDTAAGGANASGIQLTVRRSF